AVGCLIYSDPMDDGYFVDDVFPDGPTRNGSGVQRGSVMDMPTYPGDPLTPGIGATPDAKRLDLHDVTTLTKIPVLPISYADAQPLLAAPRGAAARRRMKWAGPESSSTSSRREEDSGPAHFIRRRAAAPRGAARPGRARAVARCAARHVPLR